MLTAIIFLIVLAVLIFVHELGHFLAARACGIRVDAFKIGFGPKIFAWKRGETEYGLNLVPFGGFVKIFGENPDDESLTGPDAARSFACKPRWQQAIVLVAGVAFNFVFALLLYISVFAVGVTASPEGFEKYAAYMSPSRIMVVDVGTESPAHAAGLVVGDVITSVSIPATVSSSADTSHATSVHISVGERTLTTDSIRGAISTSNGAPVTVEYLRDGAASSAKIVPSKSSEGTYAIGIGMNDVVDLRLPVFSAIKEGFSYTIALIAYTAESLWGFVSSAFHGQAKLSDVSGPIGIAVNINSAASLGLSYLIKIIAVISINLGVINLVPFPALDGGRTLMVAIEGIIRRRIPSAITNWVNTIGFAILMLLMVAVTFQDIWKLL